MPAPTIRWRKVGSRLHSAPLAPQTGIAWRRLPVKMRQVIRNVIFDWSGTLVDDLPAVLQASNHVFRLAGVPEMSRERFRTEFCLPFKAFYDRYVPHVPLPQLEAWFHAEFQKAQLQVEELPHARAFLLFCRDRGLRMFLLSSVHRFHFAAQSAQTGFAGFFERPYIEVWDKRAKIRELLRDHGLAPQETLFIGDMAHDIETAHHGGVRGCAVLTGYNRREQLVASRPDVLVDDLGQLRELLERAEFDPSRFVDLEAAPACGVPAPAP